MLSGAGSFCIAGTAYPARRYKERDYKKCVQRVREEPVHWIVPVFGVAAAAAIAFYTRYLQESRLRSNIVQGRMKKIVTTKSCKMEENMMDSLPKTTRNMLVKSRSAFV